MARTEQRSETRQRVLRAATRLIGRRGFSATSTLAIARATRLSHGTVFVHFPSRQALDLAVAAELGRAITDRLHALVSDGGDFRAALLAHVQCLAENEDAYHVLLREGPLLPRGFLRLWTGMQSAVSHHLLRPAVAAMKAGALRKTPPHLVFNTWIALVHHYVLNRALFVDGGPVLKKHGRMLVDHFLTLMTP